MLKLINLRQTYFYGANAIDSLSLEVKDGEKIAVLSKSGGGKTSLLKCIAGLFPATDGKIILDDRDITNLKIKDRGVRLVYDDGGLIRKRTVKYNLEYPLRLRKLPKEERREIALNIAKEYGLEPFYKEYAFRLFEPEIIALAIARTELRDSSLTLIDDLFSLANGYERKSLFKKYLPKLRAISGTVIFATDSLEEAFSFGDRVIVLNAGYHQQTGSSEELMRSPASFSVDELVNPTKTRIVCGVVGNTVEIDGLRLALPEDYASDEVLLSYSLVEDESGYPFIAEYREFIGEGLYKYVNRAGEGFVAPCLKEGLKVKIDTSSLKIFDRVSEKALTYKII